MSEQLLQLGLLTAAELERDSPEEPACRRYFPHGLGHSLELGVHDLAPVDGPLQAGWVMTVEPGISIPKEGLGIRLKNNVLITAAGPVDLCAEVPLEADDIEGLLADRRCGEISG